MKQLEHHHRGNAEQDALSGGLTLDLPGKAALQVVWRRKWLVLAVAGACLGVSVLRVLFATRVYCAESQLYIEEAAPLLGQNASGKSPAGNLHTQAEVIQSTPVLAIALANFRAPGAHEPLTLAAADNAIGTLKQGLDAGVGKDDDIITVSFECADKDDAEAILKGVVDAYQTFVARRHKSSAVDALVNLRREKQERERELAEKTRALNDFRRAEGTLALDGDRDALVMKQVTAMSDALTAAQLDALSAKSAFDEAAGAISDNVGAVVRKINNARAAGTLSAVSDTAMLQSELNQLQQSMKSVRQHYLPDHPMVRRLQGRLEQLNLTYVAALHNRWQAAARRHEEIGAALTTLQGRAVESNSKAAEYARLEAEMRRAERMLDVLDTRMKELNVTGDAPGFSVQVLEEAHALFAPVYPRKSVMLFQGLVLGLMLGAGLTFLDRRFRSSDEVKSTLNLPVLGVVPHMPGRHSPALRARRVHVESSSEVAEAYRAVRTALFFGLRHDEAKTV
ncbi:MAG: GumC family protein, partial [Tepidisphaeraceae bacterium]